MLTGAWQVSVDADVILRNTSRNAQYTRFLLLYRLLQLVFLPFVSLYFLVRLVSNGSYWRHFHERLGFLSRSFRRTRPGSIWLHAISVGEVVSVLPLLRALKADQPAVPIYLSTGTVAGRRAAVQLAASLTDGIFYCPIDYVSCVRRTLRTVRPALLVILETEIWPNLYAEAKRFGARLAIVNGRISDRTWPRYRRWKRWLRPVLHSADLVLVQTSTDERRYAELGARPTVLAIAPNLKYDASLTPSPVIIDTGGAQQIWVAASTVGPNEAGSHARHSIDEDEIVIETFERLAREFPKLLVILAPRQPARFEEVARKLMGRKINFVRRTGVANAPTLPGILLLDTLGELAGIYRLANVSFVGGSIAPRGGHNILEAAAAGSPIIVGPHMENFAAIAQDFLAMGALIQIPGASELLPSVRRLLQDRASAMQLGARAKQLVEARRGASQELAGRLWLLYYSASLRKIRHWLPRLILLPLAGLWKEGGTLKRRRSEHFTLVAPPLSSPVISVGGITLGGSGKTPFTVYLVSRLKQRGHSPAILTRGYRRSLPIETLILAPGAKAPSAATGDEAQIFLRAGDAPVGIGVNRYATAQTLLRQFPATDALVLDDGFQHARLARDFDIVIIDGLDPFGGEEVVPLGRLREPLEALARADAFVITRAENNFRFQAIRARLREFNPAAPVFRTRLIARSWHDYQTGQPTVDLSGRRIGAFCGLGNPENFWHTLESLGFEIVFRWCFDDHHSYNPAELMRVAHQARMHGAEILVTTEKDRINCPSHLERSIAPLQLAWLKIELDLEDEASFFRLLESSIHRTRTRHVAS